MKRWAIVTILAYAALLVLLTLPIIVLSSIDWSPRARPPRITFSPSEAVQVFKSFFYWLWLAVLLVAQGALLIIPVRSAERRPVHRRHVGWLVGVSAFLFANLILAGISSLWFAVFGDAGYEPVDFFTTRVAANPLMVKLTALLHLPAPKDVFLVACGVVSSLLTIWGLWLVVFYRFLVSEEPTALSTKLTRWLLRGSILELLIAVPSHIAIRGREECCAGVATFWGMATGISVMLLAFGPGVFFLFAHRMRRLRPIPPPSLSGGTQGPLALS